MKGQFKLNHASQKELKDNQLDDITEQKVLLAIIGIFYGLDVMKIISPEILSIVSTFSFIENDLINLELRLIQKKKTLTIDDIKGLKEIQILFKQINSKRAGNLPAIKTRFFKIKNEFGITIKQAKNAVLLYLNEEDNPEMIITCERFFYAGNWGDRNCKIMGYIDVDESNPQEYKLDGII